MHDGIKLLWQASYISSATTADPLTVNLWGFNLGQYGAFPNAGTHFLPSMNQYDIVQANGSTTFIGNDILQPFLKIGSERYKQYEVRFDGQGIKAGGTGSNAYTTGNNLLYNGLKSATNIVEVQTTVSYELDPAYFVAPIADYSLLIVLFEVDKNDAAT